MSNLEEQEKILMECNQKRLEEHFENEYWDSVLLYYAKDSTEEHQKEVRELANKRLADRKNLYIYPTKVNV